MATFSPSNPEIMIRLSAGGDETYQRPYDDSARGSVTNVGTYNSTYTAIRGGDPTGPHPDWFDLSPSQVRQCREMAAELGTDKVVVIRAVGSYRTSFTAETYKFSREYRENRRYYVIRCEIGD